MRCTVDEVRRATGARLLRGDAARALTGVSTDSRQLGTGELFLALSGPTFDGNRFAPDAARGGAGALLLDRARLEAGDGAAVLDALDPALPVLLSADPRRALGDLAAWHRRRLDLPVIGITGSCGKTTTKNLLLELLGGPYRTVGSPASFNNEIGVPRTLFLADETTQALVVEIGTNGHGEIAALCRVARPTAAIVTNVGASHLAGLGDEDGVQVEKSALPASLPADGFCVLNADCPRTARMARVTPARVLTFSLDGSGDLCAEDVWFAGGATHFRLTGPAVGRAREISLPLLGLHAVQNALAALAACVGLGLALDSVLPALDRLEAGEGRMRRLAGPGYVVYDDSYNANPASVAAGLRTLAALEGPGRRVAVLGAMHELGARSEALHREVGERAAASGPELLVLVGDATRAVRDGALGAGLDPARVLWLADLDEALERVPGLVREGDVVWVKGSRAAGLDRLVGRLVADGPAVTRP